MKSQRSNSVTVIGEVSAPVRFPLTPTGERVLDAEPRRRHLQQGLRPVRDAVARRPRGDHHFNRLVREPANNVYLQPEDTIYIFSRPRIFLAFGATGKQGQFNFDNDAISLSEPGVDPSQITGRGYWKLGNVNHPDHDYGDDS